VSRYPTYAPAYELRINDEVLPAAVASAVTSVRYTDGQNAADRVEIDIANPNLRWLQNHIRGLGFQPFPTGVAVGPIRALSAAPDGTFDIDNKLTLALGYDPDPLEHVFKGDVTGVRVSFPNGGMPSVTLVAHDYLQRLASGTGAGGFGFLPDFLIASIIGAKNLLVPLVDPTIIAASTVLFALQVIFTGSGEKQGGTDEGESDLEFLGRLAKKYDADFWVEDDVLYLSRFMKEYSPRLTLTWGKTLLDFSPTMTTVGQVVGVTFRLTLREIPLAFLVTVFWDFDKERLGTSIVPGMAKAFADVKGPMLTILDRPISSPADVASSALEILSELRARLNQRLTGSGTAVGDPRIRAGAVIRLEGLGPDFSGDYRVTSASHTVDSSGYKTSFEVRKEILP
jgi:uncharacterized protein